MGNFLFYRVVCTLPGGSSVWFDKVYRLLGAFNPYSPNRKSWVDDEQHDAESL